MRGIRSLGRSALRKCALNASRSEPVWGRSGELDKLLRSHDPIAAITTRASISRVSLPDAIRALENVGYSCNELSFHGCHISAPAATAALVRIKSNWSRGIA